MPRSTPLMSSSVDGPSGAGWIETFAIRCNGMCPAESANAQPFERAVPSCSALSCAICRLSW